MASKVRLVVLVATAIGLLLPTAILADSPGPAPLLKVRRASGLRSNTHSPETAPPTRGPA